MNTDRTDSRRSVRVQLEHDQPHANLGPWRLLTIFERNPVALVVTMPNAQRIVAPDTGHLMYLEKPQEFFALVNKFLTLHGWQKNASVETWHATSLRC